MYAGKIDKIDDTIFLVTFRSDFGEPIQLSLPLGMSKGLTEGDFVEMDSKGIRQIDPPRLTEKEIESINKLIDQIFESGEEQC